MDSLKLEQVRLIRLRGTLEERGRQHGEIIAALTPSEKEGLAFTPLSKKNQTLLRRALAQLPGMGKVIERIYEAFVLERYLRLEKKYKDRLEPFVKAAGIQRKTLWLSLYQPDMLMFLASASGDKISQKLVEGMPGCSTFSLSAGGEQYFLRNLDYPAAGFWEKNAAVFYHEPSEPNAQKYVSISSLGIHTPGLTGWNESGIAFSLHAHFSKKINLKGAPVFFLGEEILQNAKTLEEAIEICKGFKTIGSWALNITSFNEKKSIVVELSSGKTFVRSPESNPFLAHSNVFQSKEFQKNAVHFSGAMFEDSASRRLSLERSAENLCGDFSWAEALKALASHTEPNTGELRVFGNTVSVITTIQSIGFDPREKSIYLSARNETPTTLGPYLKLPFQFERLDPMQPPEKIELDLPFSEEFKKALHLYYQAYVSWQVRGEDAQVAHAYLIEATEVLPSDPHLQMQRGYFELIHGQYAQAYECFDQAVHAKLSPHLYQVALYFRAATSDLLGQRELAISDYNSILASAKIDSKLENKIKKGLNRPYRPAYCKKIATDLQFAEPLEYI